MKAIEILAEFAEEVDRWNSGVFSLDEDSLADIFGSDFEIRRGSIEKGAKYFFTNRGDFVGDAVIVTEDDIYDIIKIDG